MRHESYSGRYTKYAIHIRLLLRGEGGLATYTTTYGKRTSWYIGRLFAKNKPPYLDHLRIILIAYKGVGPRDLDFRAEYLAFAPHAVENLKPRLRDHALHLATV